jgi:hypothetical protein
LLPIPLPVNLIEDNWPEVHVGHHVIPRQAFVEHLPQSVRELDWVCASKSHCELHASFVFLWERHQSTQPQLLVVQQDARMALRNTKNTTQVYLYLAEVKIIRWRIVASAHFHLDKSIPPSLTDCLPRKQQKDIQATWRRFSTSFVFLL